MNLFYSPHIDGDVFTLDEKESKHAIRVLRLLKGDQVVLIDGRGGWYEALIEDDHPKRCSLRIRSHTPDFQPLSYHLHLAISPTKNMDRFEWFLEKATEIGISEITPLICHRNERKQVKPERLERILISAMKQSLKAYKPILHAAQSLGDFLGTDREGTKGIAHCLSTERNAISDLSLQSPYTFLVGPEGDFTEKEVQQALQADYTPYSLGDSRLRTETAGVYICSAISFLA
ncbi:MAG: 16S rRNA (uracil(1498)-N(3))-methyltransferase [Bacteroidota bacterium]